MKITFFNCRQDELEFVRKFAAIYNIEAIEASEDPTLDSFLNMEPCDCISVTSDAMVTPAMMDVLKAKGVKFISSRTVGLDHIDLKYAGEVGLGCSNVQYDTEGVAEMAVMLMLMVLRNVKLIQNRYLGQDYVLSETRGRDLKDMTVGIIGIGSIGQNTARILTGFGSRILTYNGSRQVEGPGTAVDLDTLLQESDIVSLHIPASEKNYHFLDREKIGKMKKGAIVINTARGPVVDTEALIEALENEHMGGAGLDVFEGDREIYYRDHKGKLLKNHHMAILNSMHNVVMMPHVAFYTEHAVSDMVEQSIKSCCEFFKTEGQVK